MDIKKRIDWIDVAKGIGIILVIAGHTFYIENISFVYAFHMPLFFFLSGLLIDPEKQYDVKYFITSKWRQIITPWFVLLLLSTLICLCIPQWRELITVESAMIDIYTANTNVFQNSSLWYLPCFFSTLFLYYFFNRFYKKKVFFCFFFIYAIVLLFMPTMLDISHFPLHRLPLKFDSALIAVVFLGVASWYRKSIFELINRKSSITKVLFLVSITFILSYFNGLANLNSLSFGDYRLLYYPIAFLGIYTICITSKKLCENGDSIIVAFFKYYGQNSLLIFGFQSLFIRLYLLIIENLTGQSLVLYGDNPFMHQILSFIVVTFLSSPLVVFIFKKKPFSRLKLVHIQNSQNEK